MTNDAGQTPRLSPNDFRARRDYLPDEAFALVTGTYGPPSDLVPEAQWRGLMNLPTDVVLRTSDNHGTQLAQLYDLWGNWVEILPLEPGLAPFIFNAGWDAADDFNAATFTAAHGYYRQGMANLRSALEMLTIAAGFAVRQDTKGLENWLTGRSEPPKFGNARDFVAPQLGTELTGLLNKLRRDLSGYNHSQPDATNGAIWQSNGPIWVPEAFHQTYCYFRDVMAMALVLLAIGWARFAIPEVWRPLFESPAGLWKDIPSAVPRRWF